MHTKLTKAFVSWKRDFPSLEEEYWENCVSSYVSNMISTRDRFLQLKFLHWAYCTQRRLAAIYPDKSPACPRRGDPEASFILMTWSCPPLQEIWEQVLTDVNQAAGTSIPLCPETMLLNGTTDPNVAKYTKLFIGIL